MTELLQTIFVIILTAFAVNGLKIATDERMLLYGLKCFLHKKIGHLKIYKPVIECVKCMPSIYGTIICLCFLPFTFHLLYIIPVVILCSSTLAAIIHTYYI